MSQATVSDEVGGGKAERFVITSNRAARVSRRLRSRKATSLVLIKRNRGR